MTSIALGMIVRDAEAIVARCIQSALPFVDRAVIIDTGSLDNTIEVTRDALGDIPTELSESEWVGHAHNRSELLVKVAESGADYCLMLDADMELVQENPLRELTKDEYMIPIRDRGLVYPLPLLTSTRKKFFYAGVTHSYLACADPPSDSDILSEIALIDHGGGGHRAGKIERDAELLAAEVGKNPADARSWFYLAQSYRDLDQIDKAIAAYRMRASLGGWDEEVYQALYQAGTMMCEHVNYYEGAQLLLDAAKLKPNRTEALRALAGCSRSVADKIPFPETEVLFVDVGAYKTPRSAPALVSVMPPLPPLHPGLRRRVGKRGLRAADVSAIVVTRGNVDLAPILDELPFDDVVIWNNSEREHDYKVFGRYAAIPETKNPVLSWIDDDVIFTRYDDLLAAYEPGKLVCNMDDAWIDGAGYRGKVGLLGAGSLCDAELPAKIWARYLDQYPWDDDVLVECDFIFGTLVPFTVVDLGYEVRPFADDVDRLYQQPGQTERKHKIIDRCISLLVASEAA